MGLKFIVSEAQTRSSQASQISMQAQQAVTSLEDSIRLFLSAPLSGKAYESAKNYFSTVYTPICQSIIMTGEALASAHQKFLSEYQATVSGLDTDEDKIIEEIEQYDNLIQEISDLITESKTVRPDLDTGLAQVKDCKAWNPSTGTFDINRIDMTWATPIRERWKRSTTYFNQQINAILNSSDSDAVKIAKIIKAYEDFLFNANKQAFDAYNEARKKYGDDWFLDTDEMNDIRSLIENNLSTQLKKSGIDIKLFVRKLGNDILIVNGQDNFSPLNYLYFASIVDTGAPLDLKSRSYDEQYDFSLWARNWTGDMEGDYLGNYLFGYYGQGYLLFDGPILKLGAGAAQGWSDKDAAKWLNNIKEGNWGDNPGDAQSIEDGIKDYKKGR